CRGEVIREVRQVFTKRPEDFSTYLALWGHSDNDMWHLEAEFLQPPADQLVGLAHDCVERSGGVFLVLRHGLRTSPIVSRVLGLPPRPPARPWNVPYTTR